MTENDAIQTGVELLKLCQRLQSQRDGVDRPDPGQVDYSKVNDQFAQDVSGAITRMVMLRKLLPMHERLAELGRVFEQQGKVELLAGDDYADAALRFLESSAQRGD